MGLDRSIDTTAEERKTVLILLARYLSNTTAWVYGSRVKWTSSPKSDLDMVVFSRPKQAGRVSDLREGLGKVTYLFEWTCLCGTMCRRSSETRFRTSM